MVSFIVNLFIRGADRISTFSMHESSTFSEGHVSLVEDH